MTEITTYSPHTALSEQMDYARAASTADMLPDAYRGKPANILIAIGLGEKMGLSPAESLYRINVIKGKPTAAAELIAANVRRAGHKLRVTTTDTSATCVIIRADDPEFPFEVTRDVEWARSMGLEKNDNYRKQLATMLQWRAITACARVACPEALYGVAYTPDEMHDLDGGRQERAASSGSAATRLRAAMRPAEVQDAEPAEVVVVEAVSEPDAATDDTATPQQIRKLFHDLRALGLGGEDTRDETLAWIGMQIGHEITTTKELTKAEVSHVIDAIADTLRGDGAA